MSAAAQPTPAVGGGLQEKLTAMLAAKEGKPGKANKVKLVMDDDEDENGGMIHWEIPKARLLEAIKKSSTGESEGVMVDLSGEFTFKVAGKDVKFRIGHVRGGGGWVTVDAVI
jgi:hypothetical protein